MSVHFNELIYDFPQVREKIQEISPIGSEIIHVDLYRVMDLLSKDAQNYPLKSGRGIKKSKRADPIIEGTPRTSECSFILVLSDDLDLIVTIESIEEREEILPYKTIQYFINER